MSSLKRTTVQRVLIGVSILLFLLPPATWAQFDVGSVVGVIKDPSGSVLPNAAVEIKSLATNVVRTAVTSAAGEFDFIALQPGQYSITVKVQGFKVSTQNFALSVGQRLEVNQSLEVGEATQSVTVTATLATIETASSELSNVRTTQQVVNLPLNSRNFSQLVGLAPGVNLRGASNNSVSAGYTNGRGANGAVVNGNPGEDTMYLFDGIQSVNNDIAAAIFFPPVDTIQEFKVQTSGQSAAYGGGPSIVNVTFRSGTNDFHGTFYEFLRNSDFDAKNYFDSHTNPIVPFHMNQFGANVGGPVIIPHLFNGKDKLFFFADYEGKRTSQAQTQISTVPLAAFHTGDFSALPTHLTMPGTSIPLPNNQVQQIDPTAANLMALFPLPNINPGNPALVNNYLNNGVVVNNVDQGDIRVDYRTTRSTIFGRFSKESALTISPGYLPAPAIGGGPNRPGPTAVPSNQIVLGYGLSVGANKYYEARLGWSRLNEDEVDTNTINQGNLAERLGVPNANAGGVSGLTTFSISGNVGLGDGFGNLEKIDNNWEVDQALSWVKGKHELKLGFDWQSHRQTNYDPLHPNGIYTFTGAYTGYGLADFLYGRPISSELDTTVYYSTQRFQPSFYIQDNWRVTLKLTITMGLRDDLVTPWVERANRLASFVPTNGGMLIPVGTPQFPGRGVTDGRYTNWGPRLGFAYSLDPKTVIRGGTGIYYAFENIASGQNVATNAPFNGYFVTTNSSGAAGYAAAAPISAGFPAGRPLLNPTANTNVVFYPQVYKNSTANEWNLNIQRQLTANDVLSIAYVGQTAAHILIAPNINQPTPGPGAVTPRRPYPNLATVQEICMCANAVYNSLQISYRTRLSSGVDFLGAYTFAHSIDDSSGDGNTVAPQDPYNFGTRNRGNSDFDIRHNIVLSWSYDLPFGQGKRFASDAHSLSQILIGGWKLNSIDTFQTGTPFTPVMTTSLLNTGGSAQWPNRIGTGLVSSRTPQKWFNTADFVAPPSYVFGNSGRNILYGPGTRQFDFSLFKNVAFNRDASRYIQFRVEAFNAFNTPQFNNPNASIGSPAAGTITSAGTPILFQRTSRQVQLAAKLYW
jgi:Carboxypeptidase regulatory-like domain